MVVAFTSCKSGLTPLNANYVKSEPQPLELVAGKVPATIHATFPANWFNKNATIVATPVLRYGDGEAWGNSYTFQGEKVAGNGQVIVQKNGANVTLKSSFDYTPEMQNSELYLTFNAKIGNKTVALPEVKAGDGVLATADLLNAAAEQPAIATDNFQRIIKEAHDANILFLIQQAELRSGELNKGEVTGWKNRVEKANQSPNQKVDIEIASYASPDGGYELNEKLAEKRETNTEKYLAQELQKAKVNVPVNARYTAQDWEGFKELVQKSNIQDKDLILRVLSMYNDSEQREREIKNISSVYSILTDEILPQLRRSRLTANIEIIGKSDEQISSLAVSNPKALNVEELLYAAHLASTLQAKEAIYKKVTELYPSDARGFNNLGVIEYTKGNLSAAETLFNKANQLAGSLPEANLNLGYTALTKGDKNKAEQYFGNAAGVPELNNAMGYLSVVNGNYAQAEKSFGETAGNNAAIAQIMAKDYNKAQKTLNSVAQPDATTYYLKAVVGARINNLNEVTQNLRQAITLNPGYATRAVKDLEFSKYITNSQFLGAILR
ncbi:hypothetical protein AGMMS50262_20190 [Bacteroidia bacterium]|nr:hypothetical protein AGMMS50262_20190 [Bacteroidia bacterium]